MIGAPIEGPGNEGFYTQHPGFLAYFEICEYIASGKWEKYRDDYGFPYIVNDDQWVGYDDIESIHQKVHLQLVKNFTIDNSGLRANYVPSTT